MNLGRGRAAWVGLLALQALSSAVHAQGGERTLAVHGFVRDSATGEPVPSARLRIGGRAEVATDRAGYFTVPGLAPGDHPVSVRAFGHALLDTVVVASVAPVQLLLRPAPVELAGITVEGRPAGQRPFGDPEVSVQTVTPTQVRRVPAALEADLFRSIQALPGVVAPNAYSGRLLVRGGAADQNLFLLDGYPVIHPYHLTGAFSAFHIDAVQDAELWTAVPPARYGGRLSSVLDVALREGNRERVTGTASVGLVSSSAVVEGPHARGAWFGGLRTTYMDLLTAALGSELPYRFADAYAKAYADVTPSDRVSGLVFLGRDGTWRAETHGDHFDWQNSVYGLSWRHLFGGRAVFEQRLSWSRFTAKLDSGFSRLQGANVLTDHDIGIMALRGDLRLDLASGHRVEAGYAVEQRRADTWVGYLTGFPRELRAERRARSGTRMVAVYAQDDIVWTDAFRMRVGVRGEADGGRTSLQPRLSAKYLLSERFAITTGFGLVSQYDQLTQDPDIEFDLYTADIWLTAGELDVPVARSTHAVAGVEALLSRALRIRAEAYEKRSSGVLTLAPYRPEERRFAIERMEAAAGRDRGVDVSLMRDGNGPVSGWIGYSLASSNRRVDGSSFPAETHPRQRLVAVGDVRAKGGWGYTGRFEAFEGIAFTPAIEMVPERPFDFALGRFTDQCAAIDVEYLYGARNSARTRWSKRLDVGAGRRWTDRRGRRWELSLSLLNALFDPTGVFRPAPADRSNGCNAPAKVVREQELVLPPIPSLGIRVEF